MFSDLESKEIVNLISESRFGSYRKIFYGKHTHKKNNLQSEIIFYSKIQEVYSCIYTVIQLLEVTLRNKIHSSKKDFYKTSDWFKLFEKEQYSSQNAKKILKSADDKLKSDFKKKRTTAQAEDMLCRITFGFWSEITGSNYRQTFFWQSSIDQVFPNRNGESLGSINDRLKKITTLRNRLYHYEPLCKERVNAKIFLEKLEIQFNLIVELIGFCSYEQVTFLTRTGQINRFNCSMTSLRTFLRHTGMYHF